MYQAKWFNKLVQFGSTAMTLLLTDDSGVMPTKRFDKSFYGDVNVSDARLVAEAQREIDQAVYEFENSPVEEVIE